MLSWFTQSRLLFVAGLGLFFFFGSTAINKPAMTDESEMAAAALAISKTGLPVYYMGDTPLRHVPAKDMWQIEEAPKPGYQYGLWHPPLYIYCMGLSFNLFGPHNWAARLPNFILLLLTLWLLRGIVREVLPPERRNAGFGLVAFLFLINPVILQQGLMLDIDNSVLTPLLLLYLREFLRLSRQGVKWMSKYAWLSVVMAASFWAKEFGCFYLVAALVVYVGLRREWKDLAGVLASMVVGAALFWGTWWLYCKLTGMPVMYFIRFSTFGKLAIGEGLLRTIAAESGWANAWLSVLFGLLNFMLWLSPYYWFLLILVVGWRARAFFESKQAQPLDLLLLYVFAVIGATQIYRPSGWYLKYTYPGIAVGLVLAAAYAQEKLAEWSWRELAFAGIAALAVAMVQVWNGDPVYRLFNGGLRWSNEWIFYGVIAAALAIAVKLARPKLPALSAAGLALVIGMAGANLGLSWKQRAPYATSISWNNYGEAGFVEAADYLKSVLKPEDVPICRKDFGLHLFKDLDSQYRRWINPCVIMDVGAGEELVRNITAPGVSHIVLERYSRRGPVIRVLQQYYVLEKHFGDPERPSFYILRRVR